jgi:hypothetical protein
MAQRRRVAGILALLGTACALGACRPASTVDIAWSLDQEPASTGTSALVSVVLTRDAGDPISGAQLSLEGHMSHPGMAPVVAPMTERAGGRYEARLPLTMTGEWLLVVSGTLPDGGRILEEHRIEVGDAAPPA